jgi:DNA helicase-2/ATP-dependent DNA helicase PcrA
LVERGLNVDTWVDIRRKARECHEKALPVAKGDRRASEIIAAALSNDDLQLEHYEPGSIVGEEVFGFLERASRLVQVASHQDPADEAVVIAHEIGHYKLHSDPRNEVTVKAPGLGGDPIDSGAARVEGYSPRERKEIQADIFAGEFLCPSDWLRVEYIDRGRRPSEIATELGLPPNLVMNQTIRALLLPPLRPAEPQRTHHNVVLDDSQKTAATWNKGPLLVDAGPGTGKTRTLVHRIRHLLDTGALSGSILALTFSKKAAEEMRERLSVMDADAAIEMWVGTFHAFGLELLTKWPDRVGRSGNLRILDQTGSLALLEENLTKLPLHYYQNLYEPAYELVHVLRVISRCKDELLSPAMYRTEAEAALVAAGTDEQRENAEKALEVAGIYEIYEQALQDADAVDFGDLVMLTTKLLAENSDILEHFHTRFSHILVDEYQDVNFASARLLRAISGIGTDVWVVADQRQSIYRFRGAEPSNVSRFEQEFGGTRHSLGHNYRSFAAIVRTFERFSASMGSNRAMTGAWNAHRADGGEVSLTVTPSLAAEAEAIRDKIEELRAKGVPYRDQAILGRTHLTLARLTGILEQLGVPLLYLGDLFERPEIRDLLSLISLDAEFGGIGLVRVAGISEYGASREDALAVIRWAQTNHITIFNALKRVSEIEKLTDAGRTGLEKLGTQLDGFSAATSPWTLLTKWLFERSDYLRPLLVANDIVSQQKLVAIYQLLKVCGEHVAMGDSSRKRFLDRIRRIEALNEDTAYRAVSSEATDVEAVRVMTIHGSKGLEFRAVHFPALATMYMPNSWRGVRIAPPPSLAHLAMRPSGHDAEEECLFFVGLSRAKDYLSLSRADKYTTRNASPSKFLPSIAGVVSATRYQGSGNSYSVDISLKPPEVRDSYPERELDLYMQCPARYRYQVIEGLRGGRDESAYVQFHGCVYITVGWLEQERQNGRTVDGPGALAHLATVWAKNGPIDHPFENYYRDAAESMVKGMAEVIITETGQYDRQEWSIPVGARKIVITPDREIIGAGGIVRVQRIRTGRKTKSEPDKPVYALLRRGAELKYPGKPVSVEILYLGTNERVQALANNDGKLLEKYTEAIARIEHGDFHAETDPRRCPNCQCYFICGV